VPYIHATGPEGHYTVNQTQIQDRYFLSHFSVQTSKKPISFSCVILLQLELLANVFY